MSLPAITTGAQVGEEKVFALAVVDGTGTLLFATLGRVMPGQIGLSFDSSGHVKRAHLEHADEGSRVFPIASAGWVEVAGERMRLGVYTEGVGLFSEFAELGTHLSGIAHALEASLHKTASV